MGLFPWGKSHMSYGQRPHFVATRKQRKTLSHTARTYASCLVCSINDTRTSAPEDSSVGEEAQLATELMSTLAAMSTFAARCIDASTIVAIDRWRATYETTRCHHATRKTYPGAHRPRDLIFSIFDICDTKFMSYDVNGH